MSQKRLRQELLGTSSRLAIHRAWAAFNQDAWLKVQQEQLAALNRAAAGGSAADAIKPTLHHNGKPTSP